MRPHGLIRGLRIVRDDGPCYGGMFRKTGVIGGRLLGAALDRTPGNFTLNAIEIVG